MACAHVLKSGRRRNSEPCSNTHSATSTGAQPYLWTSSRRTCARRRRMQQKLRRVYLCWERSQCSSCCRSQAASTSIDTHGRQNVEAHTRKCTCSAEGCKSRKIGSSTKSHTLWEQEEKGNKHPNPNRIPGKWLHGAWRHTYLPIRVQAEADNATSGRQEARVVCSTCDRSGGQTGGKRCNIRASGGQLTEVAVAYHPRADSAEGGGVGPAQGNEGHVRTWPGSSHACGLGRVVIRTCDTERHTRRRAHDSAHETCPRNTSKRKTTITIPHTSKTRHVYSKLYIIYSRGTRTGFVSPGNQHHISL